MDVTTRFRALLMLGVVLGSPCFGQGSVGAISIPTSSDPELEFTLVASEPAIVTPIGIAIDRRNRMFVVESHTHHRPADYTGPEHDVVKVFLDSNGDGVPETPKVFADGFKTAMNLALSPRDELYLVHRNGVVVLHDADGDGVSEKRSTVVELATSQEYPHNGLNGIVFSRDGWLYLGIGENFSAEYTFRGTDGSTVVGKVGVGGKVIRCRPDGRELEEVATGVWNPFGLEVDRAGRLFCVDNDPGGRPPCRLLHVVPGGDYGYKRRYQDTFVFNGWDGELAGTLPMLKGTGEAPCGIISADRLALPDRYAGALLVASWGDAAVEMYRLKPKGASFEATKENLVVGEKKFHEAFCPVDFAAAPDGSLYVTDWADRTSYPVHNKGRIWRLAAKTGVKVAKPTHAEPLMRESAGEQHFERLLAASKAAQFDELKAAVEDSDPFIVSAAITALAKPAFREATLRATADPDPAVRVAALLALWRGNAEKPEAVLRKALADSDARVRFLALWWVGEENVQALADDLRQAVVQQPTPLLFQAYLGAAELLAAGPTPPPRGAPSMRQKLLADILHDDSQPAALHAMAAAAVSAKGDAKLSERLLHLARSGSPEVRREAIRSLGDSTHADVPAALLAFAKDQQLPTPLRLDAIVSLSRRDPSQVPALTALLDDPDAGVQLEAARALRVAAGEAAVRKSLEAKLAAAPKDSPVAEQIQFALQPAATKRPASAAEWQNVLASGGDAIAGERIFHSAQTGCTNCHQAQGRGASIGPDLSNVARSFDRPKLIEAIIDPSREVAPQYEHHIVTTKAGVTYSGPLVHIGLDGSPLINALGTGRIRVPIKDVESHTTSPLSMMPPGLENTMTVSDFRDLLAYLLTLK